jgi:predicted Zn-dependent peptidase
VRPAAAQAGRALPLVRATALSVIEAGRSLVPADPAPLDLQRVVCHTLPNGLRLRVLPDRLVPAVSYYTFFGVGSRNERPGITGISHLFEHMMFNGSERFGPKEFDRILESHGGASNAYTSNDVTAYHEDFASEALPVVIDLESDRMRGLRLTDEALEQERSVVMEERRLRTENSHFGLLEEQLESLVYQAHPYRWPVIGWMDDIARIGREDCLAFFRTYYAPGNAAIYVCGDVDPDDLLRRVEAAYGAIPAGPPVPPPVGGEPPQRGERRAAIRFPANAPAMLAGFRGPAARERDTAVLDVLQACLSMGEGSRLRRRIVQELELAVSVGIGWSWRADPGVFMISLELAPGASTRKAEEAVWRELERVATAGVTERELTRARALLRSSTLHELATRNGVAHALGQAEALLGDWREAGRSGERYRAVTRADVRRAARVWLVPARRNVVWLEPGGAA